MVPAKPRSCGLSENGAQDRPGTRDLDVTSLCDDVTIASRSDVTFVFGWGIHMVPAKLGSCELSENWASKGQFFRNPDVTSSDVTSPGSWFAFLARQRVEGGAFARRSGPCDDPCRGSVMKAPTIRRPGQPIRRKRKDSPGIHRFTLRLPEELWDELVEYHERRRRSVKKARVKARRTKQDAPTTAQRIQSVSKICVEAIRRWSKWRKQVKLDLPEDLKEKLRNHAARQKQPMDSLLVDIITSWQESRGGDERTKAERRRPE